MKRLVLLATFILAFAGFQFLLNCSSPLESDDGATPGPPRTDTVFIFDTTIITDTVEIVDTLTGVDTIIVVDTVATVDTLIIVDTTFVPDTVIVIDTNYVIDTFTVNDTIVIVDTVTTIDTVVTTDTVITVDTVTVVDTIVVVEPGGITVCSKIYSHRKCIYWKFLDAEGPYRFNFDAFPLWGDMPRKLVVYINSDKYFWDLTESTELTIDKELGEVTTVKIVRWYDHDDDDDDDDDKSYYGKSVKVCLNMEPL